MSELTVAAKLRMVAKGVYTNGDAVLAERFARPATESEIESVNSAEQIKESIKSNAILLDKNEELKGRVKELEEALKNCIGEVESYICDVSYCDVDTAYREALIPMSVAEASVLLEKE